MMPTFIGFGVMRCGTTSVYHYLKQHPQVFMSPVKETNFFAYLAAQADFAPGLEDIDTPVRSLGAYQQIFADAENARAIGELSPHYFRTPGVPACIGVHLPGVRLFCILRNPIDRAYSHYGKCWAEGLEKRSFEQAVNDELASPPEYPGSRIDHYLDLGFYTRHLAGYLRAFDLAQLKICLFDDLQSSPARFMRELFEFIGVDADQPVNTSARLNTGAAVRAESLLRHSGLKRFSSMFRRRLPIRLYNLVQSGYSRALARFATNPGMSPHVRERLTEVYAEEIQALQVLLGRGLSHWQQP
jgi:hypothetical protein